MTVLRSVKGIVSLITGGASGLGLVTAQKLIQNGAKVVICDLPGSKGAQVVESLGSEAIFVPTDVTVEDDVKKALDNTKEKFGRLDVLLNCAAIARSFKIYNFNSDLPHALDDFADVVKVNIVGTFNVIRLAAGLMSQNKPEADKNRGIIITTTSLAAFEGQSGQAAFSAASGGIAAMTLPIARDLASHGIRCCCIAPGLFDTPLLQMLPDEVRSFLAETIPTPQRLGNPEEFAHLVQRIIENPMLNGEIIRLDGGLRLIV